MAYIKGKVKTDFKKSTFKKHIITQFIIGLNDRVNKNIDDIENFVKTIIKEYITETPEMQSLKDGEQLAKSLGIEKGTGEGIISAIAQRTVDSAVVYSTGFKYSSGKILGSIRIKIVKADYTDVLGLVQAQYISLNEAGHRTPVPWLDWLIKQGDRIIVKEFNIILGNFNRSRSGGAIMIKIVPQKDTKKIHGPFRKQNAGVGWRVPAKFSGVENNNFLTRAFELRKDEFLIKVRDYIESVIK